MGADNSGDARMKLGEFLSEKYSLWGCVGNVSPAVLVLLFSGIALVWLRGMYGDIMEVDAAQYANISAQILRTHQWLQIHQGSMNYLDKPPLLFWLSAISMYFFGVNNFAYKLPSVLASALAIYATYRLTSKYYGKLAGILSALMLASAQAIFIMTNDCRTDNLLMGFSILAIWQGLEWLDSQRGRSLIFASFGVGMAMLAKGPIGLVFPATAILSQWFWSRQWKKLINPQLLLAPVIILAVLFPMCWGLYQQYGWMGVRFFFWTQSFGRITGQNVWHNSAGPFFLVHTVLWAFLPWTLIMIPAFFSRWRSAVLSWFSRQRSIPEVASIGGFTLTFIALSMSHYKLPHYIYLVLPLAAVFSTSWLIRICTNHYRILNVFRILQTFISVVLIVAAVLILTFVFPVSPRWLWIALGMLVTLVEVVLMMKIKKLQMLLLIPVVSAIALNLAMNYRFYPQLLTYQSSSQVAHFMNNHALPSQNLVAYNKGSFALGFYLNRNVPYVLNVHGFRKWQKEIHPVYVYTDLKGMNLIQSSGIPFDTIKSFDSYDVTLLKPAFLNPATRKSILKKDYLLKLVNGGRRN